MKFRLLLFALLISAFAFCQDLEGRWVNTGFTGEENLAYAFEENNRVNIFYDGIQLNKEPVDYQIKENGDSYIISMQYINALNGYDANAVGLLKIIDKDNIEMEFWDSKEAPKEFEFTTESMIYTKE